MGARERRHRPLLVLTRTRRSTHTNKRFFHFAAEIGNNKFPSFIIIPCRAWGGKKTLVNSHKSQPLCLQRNSGGLCPAGIAQIPFATQENVV